MTELIAVVTITLLAVISPGPDFAMVSRNSLLLSRRAGVLTSIGIGGGVLVHVSYTMLGVGLVVQQSIWLFTAFKLVGAGYLVWLGVKMLKTMPAHEHLHKSRPMDLSTLAALKTGFLTNALNPKTTIFILSLFIQVVKPTTSFAIQIGYGIFISIAHVIWFSIVAVFFSYGKISDIIISHRNLIDAIFGLILIFFGVMLVFVSV